MAQQHSSAGQVAEPEADDERDSVICFVCNQPLDRDERVYRRGEPVHRGCEWGAGV
jgi:hypothetical protein